MMSGKSQPVTAVPGRERCGEKDLWNT